MSHKCQLLDHLVKPLKCGMGVEDNKIACVFLARVMKILILQFEVRSDGSGFVCIVIDLMNCRNVCCLILAGLAK